jgi:transposase
LVLTYKRLEAQRFVLPKLHSGTLALNPAQFEALFAGLDWQKVRAVSVRPPQAIT